MKHQKYYKLEQQIEKKKGRKIFRKTMYLFGFCVAILFFLFFIYLVLNNG